MEKEERIDAFVNLGNSLNALLEGKTEGDRLLEKFVEKFNATLLQAERHNGWFTQENIRLSLKNIALMLEEKELKEWIEQYEILGKATKKVGVIMAGNIPLVGLHDALCVLLSGNVLVAKLSSDDKVLLPMVLNLLVELEPAFKNQISFVEKIKDIGAVIATGSNNSARYFDYYFGKYTNIIRKNRNSIAVLSGNETEEQLKKLGKDIFQYFGMGCRNISKLFVPKNYDFDVFFKGVFEFSKVMEHNKYANNYDYHRAVYLMNQDKILDNNFLILKEDISISSPLATLFYEYYQPNELASRLEMDKDNIQCIVGENYLPFGSAQQPNISDYADGVDTMNFLLSI